MPATGLPVRTGTVLCPELGARPDAICLACSRVANMKKFAWYSEVMSFSCSPCPSYILSSIIGGGSTGRRSAHAKTSQYSRNMYAERYCLHLAPDPHALARFGC